ncbi:unnamed protein product [Larinioides sclopetarius]|uniref:Prismalin-14 n=1 Tax=Larinioides sclopetarius TaxID=280406 RepID=A0AAV1ZVD5_9ARAC
MVDMKVCIFLTVVIGIAIVECRYPYEDTYRAGDIVPYGNRQAQNDQYGPNIGGYQRPRFPVYGNSNDRLPRSRYDKQGPYNGYIPIPSGIYPRETNRRRRTQLRPRGLGGNKKYYGNDEYDYGKNRRSYPRKNVPGYYNYDDFSYTDYDQ